jgi:hypothetical protein
MISEIEAALHFRQDRKPDEVCVLLEEASIAAGLYR